MGRRASVLSFGRTKNAKIEELEAKGYEYNEGIYTLLQLDTIIPPEFVLYCLLMEDRESPDS